MGTLIERIKELHLKGIDPQVEKIIINHVVAEEIENVVIVVAAVAVPVEVVIGNMRRRDHIEEGLPPLHHIHQDRGQEAIRVRDKYQQQYREKGSEQASGI